MLVHASKMWWRGCLGLAPLAAAGYFMFKTRARRRTAWDSLDAPKAVQGQGHGALLLGAALAAWSLGGGRLAAKLGRRRNPAVHEPEVKKIKRLPRPDGSELHVRCTGIRDGIPLIFVHGLGADGTELYEVRQRLANRFRLIEWDLPGLGKSRGPDNNDFRLEKLAEDLCAVLSETAEQPAILVGHSLGGMILLTFCRLFPELLGQRVAGLVLAHTTYTNPAQTTSSPALDRALQKPFTEPLLRLAIRLPALFRVFCELSYLNGTAHRFLASSLFTGNESWELLDHLASYYLRDDPETVARIALEIFHYDETATLRTIKIPTLIIAGDEDQTCSASASRYIHKQIARSELLTLSPARHGGLLEYPQEFIEALCGWCERLQCFGKTDPAPTASL
jgi:pimeloyl-ACP methyl ester carboxylesterase